MIPEGTFTKGVRLWLNGRGATVLTADNPRAASVVLDGTDAPETVDLLGAYQTGGVQWEAPAPKELPKPLEHIAEAAWAEAERRKSILQPLLDVPRTTAGVEAVALASNLTTRTIWRWLSDYDRAGVRGLVPDHSRKGAPGKTRMVRDREVLLTEAIKQHYLLRTRPTLQHAFAQIIGEFKAKGLLPPPGIHTVRRRIAAMDVAKRVKAREGGKASRRHTVSRGAFPSASRPLQTIMIDHTPLDLQLVDSEDRSRVIGRPFLTVALDACTRMVYGWFLTLDPPSYLSVAMCLLQGVLPKDDVCARFNLTHPWPIYGLPETIHTDNGKDFRSKYLERWALQHSVGMEFRPVRTPQYGGFIERVLGTLNRAVQHLDGTTKSSVHAKGDYDSEKAAIYTIEEAEEFIARRIVDGYHTAVHSELLKSPLAAWEEAVRKGEVAPVLPPDPQRFRVEILPFEERSVQKDGLSIFGLHYTDGILQTWRARSGTHAAQAKYVVKFDPRDLSRVYFLPPEEGAALLTIPLSNRTVGAFSLLELRRAQAFAKAEHRVWSERTLPELLRRERLMREEAERKSKAAKRDTARVRGHREATASPPIAATSAPPPAPPASASSVGVDDGWGAPEMLYRRPS